MRSALQLPPGRTRVLLAVSLFAAVLGAKWWTLWRFGSDLPNWDQWQVEGVNLFAPYFRQQLEFAEFFRPHNEHRLVFTKLLSMGLLLATGQWDVRVQCAVNAMLHSALALGVFYVFAGRIHGLAARAGLWLLVGAGIGLPVAWQNLTGGFHSQQYFLLLFSAAALHLLLHRPPGSAGWLAGAACAGCAVVSMGSGLLAAAAVLAVSVARQVSRRAPPREVWPTWAVCVGVLLVGLWLRVPSPAHHEPMRAQSWQEFWFSLVQSLRWPWHGSSWAAGIVHGPLLLLAWRGWRRSDAGEREHDGLLAAAVWCLLQIGATAYVRGGGSPGLSSRYLDTLAFGVIANGVALLLLCERRWTPGRGLRVATGVLGVAWLAVVGIGGWQHVRNVLTVELPWVRRIMIEREDSTRAYLATGDFQKLEGREIPFPNATMLAGWLSQPELRALMPASVRAPVELRPAFTEGAFGPGRVSPGTAALKDRAAWGSFDARGAGGLGRWESAPFTARHGYLVFETAGTPGFREGRKTFAVVRGAGERSAPASVVPSKPPGDRWRAAYVRAPAGPLVLEAHDHDAAQWLAVSAPVEMSTGSYAAYQATKHGRLLLLGAWVAAAAVTLGATWTRGAPGGPRHPAPHPEGRTI